MHILQITTLTFLTLAAAAPGLLREVHSTDAPGHVAVVDTSSASAVTHQSFTNLVHNVPVAQSYASDTAPVVYTGYTAALPLVKTMTTTLVKSDPAPVVHTYTATPANLTYAATPVLCATPLVKNIQDFPVKIY
ncbi:uncharacterized protein LOC109612408 [Musca domestica]|uniref:Uncharacterized protein LOC109612408 n=1 Tax=Musca domestica TaxID=7370 RepID=A0A9J7DH74_MUSDO|nr:uncharacterized protein LOC109612408 [Musca domestica]